MTVTMAHIVTMAHKDIHSGNASWRRSLALTLTALAILTIGILVGLVVGNRVLTMQLAIYGEAAIEAPSMTLNLMNDFLDQPLVIAISAALLLTVLALGSWLLAGVRHAALRIGVISVLIILVVAGAWWFGLGRRTPESALPPLTPTPITDPT